MDVLAYEKLAFANGYRRIAGVDEAGRGPLAGPVVAAAVIMPVGCVLPGVEDSKKTSHARRCSLLDEIYMHAISIGIGIISPIWIDTFNIRTASLQAMHLAVLNMTPSPDYLLIDGNTVISTCPIPQQAIIKGDHLSHSISAASIVAKITRDSIMDAHHESFHEFDFTRHKGYPTRAHRQRISELGPCYIHRKTFKGVKEFIPNDNEREYAISHSPAVRPTGRTSSTDISEEKRISDSGDQLSLPIWRD